MLAVDTTFSPDFATARRKFLAACLLCNLAPETHLHPMSGAQGETLATDVVRIGPVDAKRVLVLTSGVHGVEVFAGSGCQIDWLLTHSAQALPADTAVLLVHGINPWGASFLRRYTEDNIDLCRNFVDHAQTPPSSSYAPLHAAMTVRLDDAAALAEADQRLADYKEKHGEPALYNALMAGQYAFPDGMGFGGQAPTWSRQTLERVLLAHCGAAREVVLIDYHTGLGPYGYGTMVALQPQGPALARMRDVFGDAVLAVHDDDAPEDFAPVTGHTTPGYERLLAHARVTAGVMEYGTRRPGQMLDLLVRDQREWASGAVRHALSPTRQALLSFFYPAEARWQRSLVQQSHEAIDSALAFLAHSD